MATVRQAASTFAANGPRPGLAKFSDDFVNIPGRLTGFRAAPARFFRVWKVLHACVALPRGRPLRHISGIFNLIHPGFTR